MNIRIGASWQTLFADLSIILFMITAATLSRSHEDDAGKPGVHGPAQPMPAASPVALYRAAPGSPPMAQWLAAQAPDSRERLSILVPYQPGRQAEALEQAAAMLRQAGPAVANVRVVIEPGADEATASLTYDAALAQTLPSTQGKQELTP